MAHWEVYATGGGVQKDDNNAFQKAREEEARYVQKMRASPSQAGRLFANNQLISVSPDMVVAGPADADLLIDIGPEPQIPPGQHESNGASGSAAARAASQSSLMNLLD